MPLLSAATATDLGSAAPPMITFHRVRSSLATAGLVTSMLRMVGTQWEKVTFSSTSSFSSISGT